jgi:hypothetical protein
MHSRQTVAHALALRSGGLGARRIARRMDLPVATVRDWLAGRLPNHSRNGAGPLASTASCDRCGHAAHAFDELPQAYVYLLGLYLGDGSISTHPRSVYKLRISLDAKYQEIIHDCSAAISKVAPANVVGSIACGTGTWVEVFCYSKIWPCLFPQHGPGKKHERTIVLTQWQQQLVDRWPKALLRGLIQSDGCRFINTGRNNWVCARYGFSQKSDDIRTIFCDACDRIGLHWTTAGEYTIYVSRKADVAILDEFIGPKR